MVDLGAITPFFVMFRARETVYDLLEACCGARLTVSYVRIGGLAHDVPEDFEARCRKALADCKEAWDTARRAPDAQRRSSRSASGTSGVM